MSKSIIFDTETTGTEEEDRIIQVAAIIVDSDKKIEDEVINEYCKPDIPIKIEAMAIHGTREDKIKDMPKFEDTSFYKRLGELNDGTNYLIAHNLQFDKKMVEKYNFKSDYKEIDTLACARHLYLSKNHVGSSNIIKLEPENRKLKEIDTGYLLPNYQLQTFRYILFKDDEESKEMKRYEKFSSKGIMAHDALGDVVILKMFLKQLAWQVTKRYKLVKYEDIMDKLVELTKKELPERELIIMPFGQFKGKTFKEIENDERGRGYIDWLQRDQEKKKEEEDDSYNQDILHTVDKIINNQRKSNKHNNR